MSQDYFSSLQMLTFITLVYFAKTPKIYPGTAFLKMPRSFLRQNLRKINFVRRVQTSF
jgi:hypothetical protein